MTANRVPSVTATYLRGGTSKAVFFHERDVPAPGPIRDQFLIRIMGAPDATEIDGMGGARIVTSKIALIRPSARQDADVDYTFVQIGLGEATVDYSGNCGNISSGVGPFAINEGLLRGREKWDDEGRQVVRIYNTGRDAILVAHVPVDPKTSRALEKGDYVISGCPFTGAPILMDYAKTAKPDVMLPSGNVVDELKCTFGDVAVTYCGVGNPIVFVRADSMGVRGDETAAALNGNTDVLARVREVRGREAEKLHMCTGWTKVDEQLPMLPMVALVSPPATSEGHIRSRLFLDNHCHPAMAGTGGICTATASRIDGSVVQRLLSSAALQSDTLNIEHPEGLLPISVKANHEDGDKLPTFDVLGFMRTARYLFQGQLFIPTDIHDVWDGTPTANNNTHVLEQESAGHPINRQETPKAAPFTPTPAPETKVEATKALAKFTEQLTMESLPPEVVGRLRQCLLDHIGVAAMGAKAGESSPHFLAGVEKVTPGFPRTNTVINTKERFAVQYAAMLNAAFAHTLDFDDTHTEGIIHVGVTIFPVVIGEAENQCNIDGKELPFSELIVAAAAGYEVACRIAIALGASSWHRGFHNTSVAGIFGAVAAIAKLRNLNDVELNNAFGLAVSFASGSMQYLANGSWNKRLHPAKAAHDAFIVVAMAQAGVLGAAMPIEGQYGLIAAHTDTPNAQVRVDDLGKTWELLNTGLKPYPACRVTHTSIELAALLSPKYTKSPVKGIHILMDSVPFPIVGVRDSHKVHPQDTVDAQFSAYFQAAAAWLYGDNLGWSVYDRVQDAAVQELCGKITIEEKKMPDDLVTTMVVSYEDGHTEEMTLQKPKWQQPERPAQISEVERKFMSLAVPTIGQPRAAGVVAFVTGGLEESVSKLISLLS